LGAKVEGDPKEENLYRTAASMLPGIGSGVWKRHGSESNTEKWRRHMNQRARFLEQMRNRLEEMDKETEESGSDDGNEDNKEQTLKKD
jgi:hypothetical protein